MNSVNRQFPILKDDTIGTGVYHTYVVAFQKENFLSGGGFRIFILGEGRSLVHTDHFHNYNIALSQARHEVRRRDRLRAERYSAITNASIFA